MLKKPERDALGELLQLAGAPDDARTYLEELIGFAEAGYSLETQKQNAVAAA
jgi:hypothetical protein